MLGNCCNFLQCMQIQREEAVTHINNFTENFPQICAQHERTLEEICLNSTRLSSLPPELFYCQGLRVLSVSNNNLENIPNAIGSLRQLQNLNVSRNFISSVPENLKNCKNLTHLDLSCNSLQRLPDAITCLVSLQELLLNEMYLEFLPANFGRLVNLRILELRLNSLITLPKSMGRLINLERIDIGGNDFKDLPEVIGELYKLRELWIDLNQIRRISPNIGKLQKLQHFEANGNLLESLPDEISTWNNVEVFSICTNNLKTLPNNFGFLKSLVTLKCEYCKLVELPESISSLCNLEEIVVSHNQLLRLPTTIGLLRKLRFLFADDNNLQELPDELCSCVSLTVLSVSRNKLTDIPQNIGHLKKLKVLNLVGNYISTLPVSVLSMVNLLSLWLSENQTQPLVHLQYADVSAKTRLTCFMLPQNRAYLENGLKETKVSNISTTQSSPSRRICFAKDEEEEEDCNEGNYPNILYSDEEQQLEPRLMRSPTPYPKELRLMSKYMRSGQKFSQKSDVKEAARIIPNNYVTKSLENTSKIVDQNHYFHSAANVSQYKDMYSIGPMKIESHNDPKMNNFHDQQYNVYSQITNPKCDDTDNSMPMNICNEFEDHQTLPNANFEYYETHSNPEVMPFSIDDHHSVLRTTYQPQQQQFMTPPPYHIARNYTKKTLEDLSNYDSMRKQQYLREKETSTDDPLWPMRRNDNSFQQESDSIPQENKETSINYDEQNNLLQKEEYHQHQNDIELSECKLQATNKVLAPPEISIDKQATLNQIVATENYNTKEMVLSTSADNSHISTAKKKSWLFGVHKNPTVKQINIRQESVHPVFHIGSIPNEEGIFILWIAPDSNASRLLSINDKLLDINGHDFTDISLEEAKHILDNAAGTQISIMLSRK